MRRSENHGGADILRLETAILALMRTITPERLRLLPDVTDSGGLEMRLLKAAKKAVSLEELYSETKTKRYAHARIRRLVLSALLNITQEIQDSPVSYIRVLAFNRRGAEILSEVKRKASVPVITKPAAYKHLLQTEAAATDIYYLSTPQPQPCGREFTASPVFVV
jgi:predicted nucleotidyltransferase